MEAAIGSLSPVSGWVWASATSFVVERWRWRFPQLSRSGHEHGFELVIAAVRALTAPRRAVSNARTAAVFGFGGPRPGLGPVRPARRYRHPRDRICLGGDAPPIRAGDLEDLNTGLLQDGGERRPVA